MLVELLGSYLVLVPFSKQDAIADNTTQALLHSLGLCEIVDLGHQQLTQSLGTGQDDSFQVAHDVVPKETLVWKGLGPFPELLVWRLEKQRAGIAAEPIAFLDGLALVVIEMIRTNSLVEIESVSME